MTELKPFLVRLRPDVRTLLEQTAQQRNKPIAVIINDELRSSLSKHGDLYKSFQRGRTDKLIGGEVIPRIKVVMRMLREVSI